MEPLKRVKGIAAPLERANVDTDQIIPKQFLKRIERTGFGQYLFFDWRFCDDGSPNPDFGLNQPRYEGASILVTQENFGSGSSREHAPWALLDYGFRVIIAPSYADIFYSNCFKNGMLPIVLSEEIVSELIAKIHTSPGYELEVDLGAQTISDSSGWSVGFDIDPFKKETLIEGIDDIERTLKYEDKIDAYERNAGIS